MLKLFIDCRFEAIEFTFPGPARTLDEAPFIFENVLHSRRYNADFVLESRLSQLFSNLPSVIPMIAIGCKTVYYLLLAHAVTC